MVWVPLIVAFASAIGTQLAVRPKRDDFSWIMPPILWGCVVAPPGRKKSPATTPAIRLLQELEFQLREQMRPEILQSKTNLEFEIARRKALKTKIEQSFKAGKESEARGFKVELDSLPEPEEPKTEPRLTTTDATPAMLIRLCRDNPEGLLVVADELMTVFRSCEKKGNEDLRQILLQGFDGDKPYYLDRKTEGLSDLAPQVALSLFGTAQPGVLQNAIRRAIESPDGLFARLCLAVYPRRRKFKQIDRLPDSKAEQLIRQLFSKTRPLNWKEIGASKSENDQFPFLGFDQETQSYFYEWQEELYNKRVADPDMPDYIKNHLAKHEKLVCVLALLFHVGEILSGRRKPGQITKESFVTSASWSQMLEIHAKRIYSTLGSGAVEGAHTLLNRIKAGKLENGFNARVIRHKGWSGLTSTEAINDALETLEHQKWIRALPSIRNRGAGRPLSVCWEINPHVKEIS